MGIQASPEDKAQTNFTDPEVKIMKQSNKGSDYSYNAQAVVDAEEQIIIAAEVTSAANDKQQAECRWRKRLWRNRTRQE